MKLLHRHVTKINIARPICNHLVGPEHTFTHRAMVGVTIMVVGVSIAKVLGHSEYEVIECAGDLLGYAIHGLGLTTFAEKLLEGAAAAEL